MFSSDIVGKCQISINLSIYTLACTTGIILHHALHLEMSMRMKTVCFAATVVLALQKIVCSGPALLAFATIFAIKLLKV